MLTLLERADRLRNAKTLYEQQEAAYLLSAQTAMGTHKSIEQQVTRLMVWCSATLPHGEKHSLLEDPVEILASGTAWCDQNAKVLVWACKHLLGLKGRLLELKHTDGVNGHTVCEVFYDGRWHLFDADSRHVACYRDLSVLSFDELAKNIHIVENEQHWWRGENNVGKEGFFVSPPTVYETWIEKRKRGG